MIWQDGGESETDEGGVSYGLDITGLGYDECVVVVRGCTSVWYGKVNIRATCQGVTLAAVVGGTGSGTGTCETVNHSDERSVLWNEGKSEARNESITSVAGDLSEHLLPQGNMDIVGTPPWWLVMLDEGCLKPMNINSTHPRP